jgi:H+/Na+-translocating ferredoxin:NAD+ oxidoreductase subunit G
MSDENQVNEIEETPTPLSSASRNAIGLGIFSVITAGLIALTNVATSERILEEQAKAQAAALYEIVPSDTHDNDLLNDAYRLQAKLGNIDIDNDVYIAKVANKPTAIILPWTASEGYTGPIKFIVGINLNGEIEGVRVVSHKETPGLGDKIDIKKSDWILGFDKRSLSNTNAAEWAVKKDGGDFDQLTGATITPRALVSSVKEALIFFEQHKQQLLEQEPKSTLVID